MDEWMADSYINEEEPPDDMFLEEIDDPLSYHEDTLNDPMMQANDGGASDEHRVADVAAGAREGEAAGHGNAASGRRQRHEPRLPANDEVQHSSDSADRLPSALQQLKRRRIVGKQGHSVEHKDAVDSLALRRLAVEESYVQLSLEKQKIAQNHLRVILCRYMQKIKDGHEVSLSTGGFIQCDTAADFSTREAVIRKKVLWEVAHTPDLPEGVAGWAAKRWLQAAGEVYISKDGALQRSNRWDGFYINSNMALVTCHGDFGVSRLSQKPPQSYSAARLELWCRRQPSIVAAWDTVGNKIFSVQERYKLSAICICS